MIATLIILSLACVGLILACALINRRLTAARIENAVLQQRLENAESSDRFRTIANEMLADSQKTLRDESSRQLEEMLRPLKSNLENFNRTIDEKYSREASERHTLGSKIDELRKLNDIIGQDARELAAALRGNNRVQGEWGEIVLQSLLEKAGFVEGREFDVQSVVGSVRPDVVVRFPGGSCVVIDSKVSLTAYVNWANADDRHSRELAGKAHVASVRSHITELARKSYQDIVGDNKLDFALMFIPNEAAYLAAMQIDPGLWQEAYDKRVLIISPTHLLSVLKLISQMWRHDSQTKNAIAIAEEAGKMLDKFTGFVADLSAVAKAIDSARNSCDAAMSKLSTGTGNLVRRAEKLRDMGAKATKALPNISGREQGE